MKNNNSKSVDSNNSKSVDSNKNKFIINEKIQNNNLFGSPKIENISKKYLNNDLIQNFKTNTTIPGEENLGIQKTCIGGIIVIKDYIGMDIVDKFNERQYTHIKNKTFSHKILCERKEEISAMIFVTLDDLLGGFKKTYKELTNKELCYLVNENLYKLIEIKAPWLINYSKCVIRDYYSVNSNKLRIKANYIIDDGIYDNIDENYIKGGLLINNLLETMEFYENNLGMYIHENVGILCQVLTPSGSPKNRKWTQIDVGISFLGKRLFKEDIKTSLPRIMKNDIHIQIHEDVIKESFLSDKKLFYGSLKKGQGYEGVQVNILEILYPDQIKLLDEDLLNYNFCKCSSRNKIILDHKTKIQSTLKN